jgi:hypothetical protein
VGVDMRKYAPRSATICTRRPSLVVGHDPTRLERRRGQALHPVALPHDVCGLRKGRFDVPTSIMRAQGDIRA